VDHTTQKNPQKGTTKERKKETVFQTNLPHFKILYNVLPTKRRFMQSRTLTKSIPKQPLTVVTGFRH
jgi:hypothetical protein